MESKLLKGMSIQEYGSLLEYIRKNHGVGTPKWIKYVSGTYDSRFGHIWQISMRNGGNFATNSLLNRPGFEDFPYDTLYDWIMGYLTGDWEDTLNITTL